jgi:hypothetical protein
VELGSAGLLFALLHTRFMKDLWRCPSNCEWRLLSPVLERYSPMNLLVRYRTVSAVNTQSRNKLKVTCWMKSSHIRQGKPATMSHTATAPLSYVFVLTAMRYRDSVAERITKYLLPNLRRNYKHVCSDEVFVNVTLQNCIRKVLSLNIGRITDCCSVNCVSHLPRQCRVLRLSRNTS